MKIEYRDTHEFTEEELKHLFLSVDWASGHYPEKLKVAMRNFKTVYSAWVDGSLVGLVCAMDDGIMNAYIHYLLVDPEFQGKQIGRTLMAQMKEHYRDYLRLVLIAYNKEMEFYENCGFKRSEGTSPMAITSLWT